MRHVRPLILLLCAVLLASTIRGQGYSGGSGTQEDPYLLANTDDWYAFMKACKAKNYSRGKHFAQAADIDLSGIKTPISYFRGSYDGRGHRLVGFSAGSSFGTSAWTEWGLFCSIELQEDGYFRDVVLEGFQLTFTYFATIGNAYGVLAGRVEGPASAVVRGVEVKGSTLKFSVWGTVGKFGAIAGIMKGSQLVDCRAEGVEINVEKSPYMEAGGLLGRAEEVLLSGGVSQGTTIVLPGSGAVSAYNSSVGGLVGYAVGSTLRSCMASSSIRGASEASKINFIVGGLVGSISNSRIDQCAAEPSISIPKEAQLVGGLIGQADMAHPLSVTDSYVYHGGGDAISIGKGWQAGFVGQLRCSEAQDADHRIARCFSYVRLGAEAGAQSAPFAHFVESDGKRATNHLRACYYDPQLNPTLLGNAPATGSATLDKWYTILDALFTTSAPTWRMHSSRPGEGLRPHLAWVLRSQNAELQPLAMPFEGDGSAASPFLIASYDDLVRLSLCVNLWDKGMHFRQTAAIDASASATKGEPFTHNALTLYPGLTPLGSMSASPWNGTYDGQGHPISNLHMAYPQGEDVGLFGYVAGSKAHSIRSVVLQNATVYGHTNVGGLIGRLASPNAEVVACEVEIGLLQGGGSHIGGLIGRIEGANQLRECGSTATPRGQLSVQTSTAGPEGIGGLIGTCTHSMPISQCHSSLPVVAPHDAQSVGGFAGGLDASLSDCYSWGSILLGGGAPQSSALGGFCGSLRGGSIERSYAAGPVLNGATPESPTMLAAQGFVGQIAGGTLSHTYYLNEKGVSNASLDQPGQCEGISHRALRSGALPAGFTTPWHALRGHYPALHEIAGYSVSYAVNGEGGTLAVAHEGDNVASGERIATGAELHLSITPAEGYKLGTLRDGEQIVTQQRLEPFSMPYRLNGDANLVARFVSTTTPGATCKVTYSVTGAGSLLVTLNGESVGQGEYLPAGSTILLAAKPEEGQQLAELKAGEEVLHGESLTAVSASYTVQGDVALSARFEAAPPPTPPSPTQQYTVDYDPAPEFGSVAISLEDHALAPGSKVDDGVSIRITATPANSETHHLSSLLVNGAEHVAEAGNGILDLTVKENLHVSAVFAANAKPPVEKDRVTVEYASEGVGGSLAVYLKGEGIASGTSVEVGEELELTCTITTGYKLEHLIVNNDTVQRDITDHCTHRIKAERGLRIAASFKPVEGNTEPLPTEAEISTFWRVHIYPNPCTEQLHISDASNIASFSVLSADGRTLVREEGFGSGIEVLNVQHLPVGIYLLRLEARNGSVLLWQFVKR